MGQGKCIVGSSHKIIKNGSCWAVDNIGTWHPVEMVAQSSDQKLDGRDMLVSVANQSCH